jgi:two-component system cell cycle response regulator DivK
VGNLAVDNAAAPLVLIIDDVEDNRDMYRDHLEHSGYRVMVAADGTEGIRLARELVPAVVIMDLCMPGIDGWETTLALRSDPLTSAVGIVAVSALHEPQSRQRAKEAGCDFFLAKPCLPRELALHVSECIRRRLHK